MCSHRFVGGLWRSPRWSCCARYGPLPRHSFAPVQPAIRPLSPVGFSFTVKLREREFAPSSLPCALQSPGSAGILPYSPVWPAPAARRCSFARILILFPKGAIVEGSGGPNLSAMAPMRTRGFGPGPPSALRSPPATCFLSRNFVIWSPLCRLGCTSCGSGRATAPYARQREARLFLPVSKPALPFLSRFVEHLPCILP